MQTVCRGKPCCTKARREIWIRMRLANHRAPCTSHPELTFPTRCAKRMAPGTPQTHWPNVERDRARRSEAGCQNLSLRRCWTTNTTPFPCLSGKQSPYCVGLGCRMMLFPRICELRRRKLVLPLYDEVAFQLSPPPETGPVPRRCHQMARHTHSHTVGRATLYPVPDQQSKVPRPEYHLCLGVLCVNFRIRTISLCCVRPPLEEQPLMSFVPPGQRHTTYFYY
jgi:hypothetical protein